jgi:5'-3' exonuclease
LFIILNFRIKAQLEKPILPQFRPPSFQRPSASAMNKSNQIQVTNSSNSQQIQQTKQEKITDSLASTQLEEHHDPNDTVRLWEEGWHERYYKNKFKVDREHLNECRLKVVEHYTRGLCWILQYYYHGVPSWDW